MFPNGIPPEHLLRETLMLAANTRRSVDACVQNESDPGKKTALQLGARTWAHLNVSGNIKSVDARAQDAFSEYLTLHCMQSLKPILNVEERSVFWFTFQGEINKVICDAVKNLFDSPQSEVNFKSWTSQLVPQCLQACQAIAQTSNPKQKIRGVLLGRCLTPANLDRSGKALEHYRTFLNKHSTSIPDYLLTCMRQSSKPGEVTWNDFQKHVLKLHKTEAVSPQATDEQMRLQQELLDEENQEQARKAAKCRSRKERPLPPPQDIFPDIPVEEPSEPPCQLSAKKTLPTDQPPKQTRPKEDKQTSLLKSFARSLESADYPIFTNPRVERWNLARTLKEIQEFPDCTEEGKRRYAGMNNSQLKNQILRHDASGITRLLQNGVFREHYAMKTQDGLMLLKAQLVTQGNEAPQNWSLASVRISRDGGLVHFFCHPDTELIPKDDAQQGSILEHLFHEIQGLDLNVPASAKTEALPPLQQDEVAIIPQSSPANPLIRLSRRHPLIGPSALWLAPLPRP